MKVRAASARLIAVVAMASACGGKPAPLRAPSPTLGQGLRYEVVASEGGAELAIEAAFEVGTSAVLGVDGGAARFVEAVEIFEAGAWQPVTRSGREWFLPQCSTAGCRLRHRFKLRDAAAALDDYDLAADADGLFVGSPSAWLLHPLSATLTQRYRIHVATPKGLHFAAGLPREGNDADTYQGFVADLHDAPNCTLGPSPVHSYGVASGNIDVVIAPGKRSFDDELIGRWTQDAAASIAGYFGRFPLDHSLVLILPVDGQHVGFGRTGGGGGGAILVDLGRDIDAATLHKDWVLTHEMVHLSSPLLQMRHRWLREGLATYVEPIARARRGLLSEKKFWDDLVTNLHYGLPEKGDQGLDHTPTWGRTYWGGALFCLMVDLELRTRTHGAHSLETALRGVLGAGGSIREMWTIDELIARADKTTGTTVLREMYDLWSSKPVDVDLPALWKRLGVVPTGTDLTFDDTAPLSDVRKALWH